MKLSEMESRYPRRLIGSHIPLETSKKITLTLACELVQDFCVPIKLKAGICNSLWVFFKLWSGQTHTQHTQRENIHTSTKDSHNDVPMITV